MAHPIQLPQRSLGKTPAIATIVSLCLALFSIASAAIFIKFSEQEISPYATAFNRFWITTVILALWSGFNAVREKQENSETPQSSPYTGAIVGQLFLVGLFLAADLILWAWSLTQTSVANATLLANLTPVFSCLGGWLFCRRRFDRQFLLGMGIAIAAIFAIGLNDCQIGSGKFLGDIAALIAAMSFSVYLSVLERLQSQLGTTRILFWSSAIATVVSLPIVLISGGQLFPTSWQGWVTVIALAGVCQILGQAMLVHSLDRLSSEFVALFLLLEPIVAGVAAWALFSEQLGLLNLGAFAIALVGVYLSLSSPSALRDEATQPSFATLQVETDQNNREQEVVNALLNSCVAKKEISVVPETVLAGVKRS
ncbi:MAG TPA: DMT family transporter [Chroococcales cyanobacterium]|jgi:drug/metabolite transporter (DMT)-like permease